MTEQGAVIAVDGDFATVRIGRNSACASCGKCGMTEGQKYVDFFAANSVGAKVGDTVQVTLPQANATLLALVGYILPLLPALVLLFVAIALGWGELVAVLMFFVGYAVGFSVVALIDKAKKRKWTKQAVVTTILNNGVEVKDE